MKKTIVLIFLVVLSVVTANHNQRILMYLLGRSYSIDKIIIVRAKQANTQNHYSLSCVERRQRQSFCVWSPQGVCIKSSSELLQFFLCYLFFMRDRDTFLTSYLICGD